MSYQKLRSDLTREVLDAVTYVSDGKCVDYPSYRAMCERIATLRRVINQLHEAYKAGNLTGDGGDDGA